MKRLLKAKLDETCETGMYTLKFHLQDLVVDELEKFGYLEFLDASPFERIIVYIKRANRTTCQQRGLGMVEIVNDMNTMREEVLRRTDGTRNVKHSSEGGQRIHIEQKGVTRFEKKRELHSFFQMLHREWSW